VPRNREARWKIGIASEAMGTPNAHRGRASAGQYQDISSGDQTLGLKVFKRVIIQVVGQPALDVRYGWGQTTGLFIRAENVLAS
jgi:hypothetical protein